MNEVLVAVVIIAAIFILVKFFGTQGGASGSGSPRGVPEFARFPDSYETLEQVADALTNAGLESCNLLFGIDYTASNQTQGRKSFGGKSLHHIQNGELNPYQQVIKLIGRTLAKFDEDNLIPVYGFGDITTKDRSVFSFFDNRPCRGVDEILSRYTEITPSRQLSGPTSFAPLINKAIEVVRQSGHGEYHILIIIADGQVTSEKETIDAIVKASQYPLSIVMIGVGDGPWDQMEKFDDKLEKRVFDNFQFVDFRHITTASRFPDASFALHALMEIPEQFQAIKKLGYLGKKY
jgi:E3 ubiquitin-protein ligase RGLG